MYSLFTQNFEVAATACDVYIAPAESAVQQISTHSFITFSDRSFTGSLQCLNGDTNVTSIKFLANKMQPVTLPPGCILDSEQHVFSSGDRAHTRSWSVNISIPQQQFKLTGDLNFSSFHEFRLHSDFTLKNSSTYHLPIALQHWRQWLDNQQSSSPLMAQHAMTPWACVVMIGIGISQILLFTYVRHALSRHPTQVGHPSHSGPGPSISVMTVNNSAELPVSLAPPVPSAPSPTDMPFSRFLFPSLRK